MVFRFLSIARWFGSRRDTSAADKTDIYSFMTFDGGTSLFGVVGGQNFS